MKLRDYSQLRDDLRKIIPVALKNTQVSIPEIIKTMTIQKHGNLHKIFPETVDKTKFVSPIFNPQLEYVAQQQGIDYIQEEAVGYDAILRGLKLENKLSFMAGGASFATGNNHSKTKVPHVFCTKLLYDVETNKITDIFAAIVDLSKATNPLTRWDDEQKVDKKTGKVKNNNGFSKLLVHKDDADCVTVIFGGLKPLQWNSKYYHPSYEAC